MTKTDTATVEALASAAEARFLCWSLGSRGPEWIQSHAATLRALAAERDKLRAENERLREAAQALHDDMLERARCKMDVIHGEEYRIVNAGNGAWMTFCAALEATK